jgi:hypothetical protein
MMKRRGILPEDDLDHLFNVQGDVFRSVTASLLVSGISQVALAKSWRKTEKGLSISVNFGGIC